MAPTLEQRTIRKVGWRLLPLIVVIYFVAYIDRTNVSFAALTMNKELGLSPYVFGWGAGILLPRLFPVRGAEQRDPREGRSASLDRAHHDHLGPRLRRHGIRHRTEELPHAAIPARRRRGRLLPRHDPLFHLLVPESLPRAGDLGAVHRRAGLERGGGDRLRCHSRDGRTARDHGLAVDLHHRGDPGDSARLCRPGADDRSAGGRRPGSRPRNATGSRPSCKASGARSRAPAT